jgi:hypothetical protein
MSRPAHFSWFQNSDGSHNQSNLGTDEARRQQELTQQQHDEARRDFEQREAAYRAEQERQRQGGGW